MHTETLGAKLNRQLASYYTIDRNSYDPTQMLICIT
jgi:hypothetical protein